MDAHVPPVAAAILSTLAYFDLFDYPLTREELYRWLWYTEMVTTPEFEGFLEQLQGEHKIIFSEGYYVLPNRSFVVQMRQKKIPWIEKKMRRATRACRILRWVPFVEAVFVSNTVAAGVAKKASDIDLLVIAKEGRLYLARLLVTGVLSLFRLRRTREIITDRICLCFYLTPKAFDLASIRMGDPDIYLVYWLDQLVPVYDPRYIRDELLSANTWARHSLPRAFQPYHVLAPWQVLDHGPSRLIRRFFEIAWRGVYGDILENQAKHIQQEKMKRNFGSVQDAPDSRVVVNDAMLKFHENDRRTFFREAWQRRCQAIFGN